MYTQSICLTLGGIDPCGAAGIMADVKTFEQGHVLGMAVATAITFQNDVAFKHVEWQKRDTIFGQLDALLERFEFDWVKVGIIESPVLLLELVLKLKQHNPKVKIVWDSVIRSSSGFTFHTQWSQADLQCLLKELFIITPNREEALFLIQESATPDEAALKLSEHCIVVLKGGHLPLNEHDSEDVVYHAGQLLFKNSVKRLPYAKRGTGCVFSAALLSSLANGNGLQNASIYAQQYVNRYLKSSEGLLGFHVLSCNEKEAIA